jgi:hypothetical protein
MIEPLLFGIVLGMISVSLAGLFVSAWLQRKRIVIEAPQKSDKFNNIL